MIEYHEMIWAMQDEGYRRCDVCDELKITKFVHEVCEDCHNYDTSQCDECSARAL